MLEITSHERRALRAKAHHLHPVVTIGQQGLTPTVLTEIDLALNAHGLVKVRVFLDDRDEREALFAELAEGLEAAPVQHIGKLFVLWRPQPEPEVEAPPRPSARAKRAKAPAGKPKEPTAAKPFEPAGRRARGQPHAEAEGSAGERAARRRPRGDRRVAFGKPSGAPSPTPQRPPKVATAAATSKSGSAPRGPSAPNPRRRRAR